MVYVLLIFQCVRNISKLSYYKIIYRIPHVEVFLRRFFFLCSYVTSKDNGLSFTQCDLLLIAACVISKVIPGIFTWIYLLNLHVLTFTMFLYTWGYKIQKQRGCPLTRRKEIFSTPRKQFALCRQYPNYSNQTLTEDRQCTRCKFR